MSAVLKFILLQTSRGILSLTRVKSGRRAVFGVPQNFELPENLRGGRVLSDIPVFAKFVRECILAANLDTKKILFCLEDDNVICKEYQHLPCKSKNLLSFAKLEAEAVLSDNVDDYMIQNYEYGYLNEVTGKLTSALFAVKNKLIVGIRKGFSQCGLSVIKIIPPIGGLLYAAKTGVDSKGQTVAVLDLGFEKTRLLVLHDGFPIFQRTFEGVYEDIIEIVRKNQSVSFRDAVGLVGSNGVYGENVPDSSSEAAKQIAMLLDASASEAVRNIRMVISSERLELNQIILCGAMSTLPNFSEFWNQLGLDVSLKNIDLCAATGRLPEISPKARGIGLRPSAFFTFSGLLAAKKADDIDFLNAAKAKSGTRAANVAVLAFITLLALGVMALEPLLYSIKTNEIQQDNAVLSDTAHNEVKGLLQKQSDLSSQLAGEKSDRAVLPYAKSKTEETAKQLFDQVAAKARSIDSFTIDNTAGSVSLTFTVANYSDYLSIKHDIEANRYFTISIPFSIALQSNGAYSCSTVLSVTEFTPWNSDSKGGDGK